MDDRTSLRKAHIPRLLQKSVEWYTPPKFIRAVQAVLKQIELDPASNAQANRIVQASRYFDKDMDGLRQSWKARTIFLNPPYCKTGNRSNQEIWTCKLVAEYEAGNVDEAILLVTAAIETEWFQRLGQRYPVCLVKGRIRFWTPDNKTTSNATIGSAFVYLGPNGEAFAKEFSQFGLIVYNVSPDRVFSTRELWETLPLPPKQIVLKRIIYLYTEYEYKRVTPLDIYEGTELDFEEIHAELLHLEADETIELVWEKNTFTHELVIDHIHLRSSEHAELALQQQSEFETSMIASYL